MMPCGSPKNSSSVTISALSPFPAKLSKISFRHKWQQPFGYRYYFPKHGIEVTFPRVSLVWDPWRTQAFYILNFTHYNAKPFNMWDSNHLTNFTELNATVFYKTPYILPPFQHLRPSEVSLERYVRKWTILFVTNSVLAVRHWSDPKCFWLKIRFLVPVEYFINIKRRNIYVVSKFPQLLKVPDDLNSEQLINICCYDARRN